jgi:magnesium transporter
MSSTDDVAGRVVTRVWRNGELIMPDCPAELVPDFLGEDGYLVWVDLCEPSHEQLARLEQELALDPLAVEDAVANLERTKAIRYGAYTALTAYATYLDTTASDPGQAADGRERRRSHDDDDLPPPTVLRLDRLSVFVLPRGVVTIRRHPGFDIKEVLARTEENADLLTHGPGALLHSLLDVVVDSHFDAVQTLDDAMEDLEDGLFDNRARTVAVQRRTYQIRKQLVQLRRVTLPMRDLVDAVLRHRRENHAATDLNSLYDDLYDHVLRVAEWTESLRDMISTVFETNLSLQDARLNTVMKKLTAWAAIIAVPTAVTGYFGQNVPYPGFGQPWGFALSAASIIIIATTLYLLFHRKDWL